MLTHSVVKEEKVFQAERRAKREREKKKRLNIRKAQSIHGWNITETRKDSRE